MAPPIQSTSFSTSNPHDISLLIAALSCFINELHHLQSAHPTISQSSRIARATALLSLLMHPAYTSSEAFPRSQESEASTP